MAVGGLAVTEDSGALCKVNISDGKALKHEGHQLPSRPPEGSSLPHSILTNEEKPRRNL